MTDDDPQLPTLAQFAVTAGEVPITQAIFVGEVVRRALIRLSDGWAVFVGRTAYGDQLRGHHHAHYLCEPNARGRISTLTVWAPMGFDARAVGALAGLRTVWHGPLELELTLRHLGQPEDLIGRSALVGPSDSWRSLTPFVPTRMFKRNKRGRIRVHAETGYLLGGPQHDAWRLAQARGMEAPQVVECRDYPGTFIVERVFGDGERAPGAYFMHLRFPEPRVGPITLGYGVHFGLGVFTSAASWLPTQADEGAPSVTTTA